MGSSAARVAMLLGAAAIVFGITVGVGLHLLPGPHTETDFLVVGSVATLLSLIVVFAVLLATGLRTPNIFFKRRQKESAEGGGPSNPE